VLPDDDAGAGAADAPLELLVLVFVTDDVRLVASPSRGLTCV
jgi:hypothetical protein